LNARSLIIGASGLVGSAIAANAGPAAKRAIVDWSTPRSAVESLRPTLREFLLHGECGQGYKRIYWAAGRAVIASSDSEIERELETFGAVSRLVFEHGTSSVTIVLISSAGALFRGFRGPAITESTNPDPPSTYGMMKLAQEHLISAGCKEHGHRALILRAPTVYGPHQDITKQQGLISALIRSIRTSSLIPIFVPRDSRRNYLWADDLAHIALALPDKIVISPSRTAVRIVATDRSRTIDEVVETVARVARRRPIVQFMPTNHSVLHGLDLTQRSKFSEIQHLRPFTTLAEGVHRLLHRRFPIIK
jgi:UDP-glucose 4-epimerase